MAAVSEKYVDSLPPIYRDILQSFPQVDPSRKKGYGLAIQTIHAALNEKYGLGEIRAACLKMAENKAVDIRNGIFVHPTELGEELIAKLTGQTPLDSVPAFPPILQS